MVAASSTAGGNAPSTGGTPTSMVPASYGLPDPPAHREVARPVSNLGNTCYMNAVLQALAHAPELCRAMDCEPHRPTCPIFLENNKRISSSPTSSPEGDNEQDNFRRSKPARKLRRSSRKSPTSGMSANGNGKEDNNNKNNSHHRSNSGSMMTNQDDQHPKYCALCEMEYHLSEVHNIDQKDKQDKAVAPSFFVHGFIENVAPWFKLGQQEDSHEFLRLLIDAMQHSCKNARPKLEDDAMEEDIPPIGDELDGSVSKAEEESKDVEYPFQLFRGTVQSCVTCDSCKATSSTMDPIEDVGLEVTPHAGNSAHAMSTRGSASSPSNSNYEALADVSSAFQRFARVENLDAGYKCEKCGKGGRATKQSRLASVPPILTLHLKRFRYGGDTRGPSPAFASSNRRTKSGSSKIEGHIKFDQIFDLKPYLTDELQSQHKKMFCRLFAVIVHAGKNSHSGHYIAYVRNIAKNEWWKMDDARVTIAMQDEVMQAEAYMLFYRVMGHPVTVKLEQHAKKVHAEREAILKRLAAEVKAEEEKAAADAAAKNAAETEKENLPVVDTQKAADSPIAMKEDPSPAAKATPEKVKDAPPEKQQPPATTSTATSGPKSASPAAGNKPAAATSSGNTSSSRKRSVPEYTDGRSWARANTRLKSFNSIRSAEEYINENVQFKPGYFKLITEEGNKASAKNDQCPIKLITRDDVAGGYERWEKGLKECIYRLSTRYEQENDECFFTAPVASTTPTDPQAPSSSNSNLLEKFVAVGNATVEDSLL